MSDGPSRVARRHAMVAAAAIATAWTGARGQSSTPRIVASFSVLADMARMVAPVDADVTSLVGPDADAHVFEPTPADARRLKQADVVVINGLGFEGWMERLIRVSGFGGLLVVASRGVSSRPANTTLDPHAWQNLLLAQQYATNLRDAFTRRWPDRRVEIDARGATAIEQMGQLHRRVLAAFGNLPREERRVITTHEAFAHFGAAYGVDFLTAQGWSTQGEPSAAAVARLIRQIRQTRATALFVENISNRRLMDRIAAESGARIGGTLYSDALSAPGGPADTYLKMFEHNARTLLEALAPGAADMNRSVR